MGHGVRRRLPSALHVNIPDRSRLVCEARVLDMGEVQQFGDFYVEVSTDRTSRVLR